MSRLFPYKLEYQDKSRPLRPISPIHRLLLKIASTKIVPVSGGSSSGGGVQFSQTDDPIGRRRQEAGYSQAVLIPANARVVITAGQVGYDLRTGRLVETSVEEQIEAAFDCVDAALRGAGVRDGCAAAYRMVGYLLDVVDERLMMEIWRRKYPECRPLWTAVGVAGLSGRGVVVEIQGEAAIV